MTLLKQVMLDLSNRFLLLVTLFYIAGILSSRLWVERSAWLYLVMITLCLMVLVIRKLYEHDIFKLVLLLAVAFYGGTAFLLSFNQPSTGLVDYFGEPVYIEGTVSEDPVFYEDHTAYVLQVSEVETSEGSRPVAGKLMVKVYGEPLEQYCYGAALRFKASIIEPRGQRNPGGFDYRFFLKSRGIDALAYPRPERIDYLGEGESNTFSNFTISLRRDMTNMIEGTLPSPSGNLLTAILFGQRHNLPETIAHDFQRAGTGHLLAVSGLHVGLVAALLIGVFRLLGFKGKAPLVVAAVLVLSYAFLTGMRPSAMRAAIMAVAAFGALMFDREKDLPSAVSLAALITLVINPLLLFAPGFQFSYAATLSLIYGRQPLAELLGYCRVPGFLREPVGVVLAAQAGVLTLCIYYFQHLPTGAVFFNLLLMPLIAFIIGLGLLGALVGLLIPVGGEILLWGSRPLLEIMLKTVELSRLPGFYITLPPPQVTSLIIYYLLIALLMALYYQWARLSGLEEQPPSLRHYLLKTGSELTGYLPLRKHALFGIVLFTAVIVVWKGIIFNPPQDLKVTFVDVGQGASALIEAPCGIVIMVDAGGELPFYGSPGDIGDKVLLPFLRRERIDKIDLAIITHPHEDHFGGFFPLVRDLEIDLILISPIQGESSYYQELLEIARNMGIAIKEVGDGEIWGCEGGLLLEILGPPQKLLTATGSDLNNNSIVFRLQYGSIKMLFTGDIEDAAVTDLFRRDIDLRANVLQVPHHGGYMEQMPQFLEEVRPCLAVIQVGPNPFGHPHPYIIESLDTATITTFRNDLHGAVIIKTDGADFEVFSTEKPLPALR